MEFEYTLDTPKGFDDAVASIATASQEKGFRVLHVHDVQATLAEKGFRRDPLKIVEICNAKYASEALQADVKIALMLPCPIVVYTEAGRTKISTMRPRVLSSFYPKAGVEKLAADVDDAVISIVQAAAGEGGAK